MRPGRATPNAPNTGRAATARGLRRLLLALPLLAAAGCAEPVELDLPVTVQPTRAPTSTALPPTPEPEPSLLVVCLGEEPESLYRYGSEYLYGSTGRAAETVLQAIYDGPLDVVDYEYQTTVLDKLPDLADGDARIQSVQVARDNIYLNPDSLQPDSLEPGDPYLPAGCRSGDCVRTYGGGSVSMDQLVVDFRLRPGITWSDGEPLTAADSAFAFELDRSIETPTPKAQVDRTASYVVVDELTARWTGIPGYIDSEYFANFWSPLPEHQLSGFTPAELLTAEETTIRPLGWGPYMLEEWTPGVDITLRKNGQYFRSAEGLPAFDTLLFRFLGDRISVNIEQLLTSECDVLDESATADALNVEVMDSNALESLRGFEQQGRLQIASTAGAELERLDFNLSPSGGQPTLFGDPATRRGLAACLNRELLALELLHDISTLPASYLPPAHPLAGPQPALEFDPTSGAEQLRGAGWLDDDDDPSTPRVARGMPGVLAGTELRFELLTTPDGYHRAVAERIQADLAECGAAIELDYLPQDELFRPWPDGVVFGRQFEAVLWAWPGWVSPLCEMYASREIPGTDNSLGINAAGFADRAYDTACNQLLYGLPGEASYVQGATETQRIYAEQLPSIPLFMRPRVLAHGIGVCGFDLQPAAFSALWNLEEIRSGEQC